ncbi:MAG TPA: recombination mediator RecR [Fimbriimonadales bacterium]|nr:recombination mediator RecR [Fimbriimonadales bacterium]
MIYSKPLANLIAQLEKLPGIGPKSAQRLAYYFLRQPEEAVIQLADALREARTKIRLCSKCQGFSEHEVCELCSDPDRDSSILCIVAEAKDVSAIERMNKFNGLYHVLHGVLSPMDGVGPEQLKIRELLARIEGGHIKEVIIATNPTVEGDATALYLAQLLKPLDISVTRLAHGIPVGGDLDFADQATLLSAFEYRREL